MKVIEHIQRALEKSNSPEFSYEIVPPPRGRSVKEIIDIAEALENKMVLNEKKYPLDKAKGSSKKYTEL